jgi:tetratricopeptide (TPR) repeat protein
LKKNEIDQRYKQICQSVTTGKLKSAIDALRELIRATGRQEYHYELDELTDNYKALLKYAFSGYQDPQQKYILDSLSVALLGMADALRDDLSGMFYPMQRIEKQDLIRKFGEEADVMTGNLDNLFFSGELAGLLDEKKGADLRLLATEQLFKLIWLSRLYKEPHMELVRKVINSDSIIPQEKSLVVSAITLSLLQNFDIRKFSLLFEFVEKREELVQQRALTGLVLALIRYDDRLRFYPQIQEKLSTIAGDDRLQEETELILLQLMMARETEKITQQFAEEVLPEMQKMMPGIEDKLQLEKLFENDNPDDENPGWKELMDEVPGLFEKVEKFTRMQMEGADVFMGTFSMLKRFDFFNRMSNWFIPFYSDNPELLSDFRPESEFESRLLRQLEKAFYICNSDKYSFALNFLSIPEQQKSLIVTQFEAEMEQMNEMVSEEEILGQKINLNAYMIQYIQDLYRFFRLFPNKNEFQDPFALPVNPGRLDFYTHHFERKSFLEKAARFLFDNGHYHDAIELYRYFTEKENPTGEYFEKIAFAFQKLGNFRDAVSYYKKAELFDTNRYWILKKLGWCHLKLSEPAQAVVYFKEAALLQPEDLALQAQIGQCYLALGQHEEALEHFSRVWYFQPENMKALRPVAYCHFILGRLEEADGFYDEILQSGSPSPYDYMNTGHVLLCRGQRRKALETYGKCFTGNQMTAAAFQEAFREDAPFLLKNGVKEEELPLILDSILFEVQ